ncbi:MAG TPA: glycosyltransferase family 4 protein [Thermoleophilaceae bacterium]|nr:glycosyltransferase family 4 protein [Thermoleophilaceae bacterium]
MAGDSRPVALITGTISPYRREPFRLLGQDVALEVLAYEDTGPPIEGLVTRGVTQAEAARLVAGGRYRAVVAGLGGRVALPGAYAAARLRGIPFVLWATIWEHPRTLAHRLSWLPTRHLYRHADAVATYGAHVSRYVERHRGDRGRVFVAPQAVDVDHFAAPVAPEDREAARGRAGAGPGQALFLFVGRLEAEKGIEVLLEAWRTAAPAGARLAFAGTGPLADKIARQGPTVRSLGYVAASQLPALYAAADALVLPSVATATFREPWGLVVNEAMLQHTPVIASDAVGAAAAGLVDDGRTGLVFPAGDAGALGERIGRLTTDVQAREEMAVRGRTAALALDPAGWARGMRSALDSVLTARGATC